MVKNEGQKIIAPTKDGAAPTKDGATKKIINCFFASKEMSCI